MSEHKATLRAQIEERVAQAGGELRNIGGDCYAAVIGGATRLLLALKESEAPKKPWVGVPQPVLEMLLGARAFSDGTPVAANVKCAFILLQHMPAKTLLVIPLSSVAQVIIQRAQATRQRSLPVQFHIDKRGYRKYFIKNDEFRPDIPVTTFSLDALWPCLDNVYEPRRNVNVSADG